MIEMGSGLPHCPSSLPSRILFYFERYVAEISQESWWCDLDSVTELSVPERLSCSLGKIKTGLFVLNLHVLSSILSLDCMFFKYVK